VFGPKTKAGTRSGAVSASLEKRSWGKRVVMTGFPFSSGPDATVAFSIRSQSVILFSKCREEILHLVLRLLA
jgi:hypothetical protein